MQLSHSGVLDECDYTAGIIDMNISISEINRIVKQFADAAQRAKIAGFDGVQLHTAHGYFLNRFLTPLYNHRSDRYGGDIAGRSLLAVEIIKAIKRCCGDKYPLFIKNEWRRPPP